MALRPRVVLQVEDLEADRLFFAEGMKMVGAKATLRAAGSGEQAIDYLSGEGGFGDRERFPFPDLVFLDIKLVAKSGFDVLEWLRAFPPPTFPVVLMMSASDDPKDVQRAYQLGASGYLPKPGSLDELIGLLKSVDDFWLQRNRFPGDRG